MCPANRDGDGDRRPLPRQRFVDRTNVGAVPPLDVADEAVAVVGIDGGVLPGT